MPTGPCLVNDSAEIVIFHRGVQVVKGSPLLGEGNQPAGLQYKVVAKGQ